MGFFDGTPEDEQKRFYRECEELEMRRLMKAKPETQTSQGSGGVTITGLLIAAVAFVLLLLAVAAQNTSKKSEPAIRFIESK